MVSMRLPPGAAASIVALARFALDFRADFA
jgi:hypothetical protein